MGAINSDERPKDSGNKIQVKKTEPVVSVAVPATSGASTGRPAALNIPPKAIGNEIHKNNLAQLETLYVEERKHYGEIIGA